MTVLLFRFFSLQQRIFGDVEILSGHGDPAMIIYNNTNALLITSDKHQTCYQSFSQAPSD